ncbi:alpha-L-fucosidase [Chitinophagaceae bacterium LWZ2-11]
MKQKIYYLFIALSFLSQTALHAQGDEANMFNKAQQRDQKAVKDAVTDWWVASMKNHDKRVQWWRDARFGMFIHWGIYSLPGGEWKGKKVSGYAEHLMRKEQITRAEYLDLAHQFDPVKFDADKWVSDAKNAGMKYIIITAKHHDGFAMYDSKVSDFNIVQQTAWKHDPMADLSAACKKYGIKFGFYYSHAFDWEHPDAPGNDWEYNNPGGDKNLFGGANWFDQHPELLPKAQQYVTQKAIPQIQELINKYHPDILWFDTPGKLPLSENIRVLQAIRALDLNVVVNGRLVRSASANFGDYKNTADRPEEFFPVTGDWEAIPTTNESYGYSKYDLSHKSPSFFIQLLAKAASRGGNLLMNIGPKGDGTFDTKDLAILKGIGTWMQKNGESIYGTTASPLPFQNWGVSTLKANRIYLHVFDYPSDGKLNVGGLKTMPGKIYLLSSPSTQLKAVKSSGQDLQIDLPAQAPDSVNTVIVMEFTGKIQTDSVRFVSSNIPVTRLLAFDATQHGKAFGFGDGKTDKYYTEGWKSKDQSLSWAFRTNAPGSYKMMIRYVADNNCGGSYKVTTDKNTIEKTVVQGTKNFSVLTEELGQISLNEGVHEIKIEATDITKQELMKVLEIRLVKVNN